MEHLVLARRLVLLVPKLPTSFKGDATDESTRHIVENSAAVEIDAPNAMASLAFWQPLLAMFLEE